MVERLLAIPAVNEQARRDNFYPDGNGPSLNAHSLEEVQALNPDTKVLLTLERVQLSDIRSDKPLLAPQSTEDTPKVPLSQNTARSQSSELKERITTAPQRLH